MSSCPICKGRDGFPQTIQKEKVTTSGFYVSSRTESNQFVFCKKCRVQFEPLTYWSTFEMQEQQIVINNMSPSEKMLHQTPLLMSRLRRKRGLSWSISTVVFISFALIGFLTFEYDQDPQHWPKFFIALGGYIILFTLYLKRNKRKMSDVIEMENRARRELGR